MNVLTSHLLSGVSSSDLCGVVTKEFLTGVHGTAESGVKVKTARSL